ncbi:MAG: 3-deoxy-D-manno-octulosonic acid transferase [Thermoflavifilum sp.]|nr:3-deoxy-D-manno-octulosonic acid transferase [Thermoflavifilum sp.]
MSGKREGFTRMSPCYGWKGVFLPAMRWLYHLGIWFYVLGIRVAAWWMPKARRWLEGRRQQRQQMATWELPQGRQRIWMHCASAGEYEQGRPVLEAIRKHCPHAFLILSFFSPSGYDARKTDSLPDLVLYLPADLPGRAEAFLHWLQPQLALFVKYDFWYGYIRALRRQHIPGILISARFGHQSFFSALYMPFLMRLLRRFTYIFVQDEFSKQWLLQHGIHQVEVGGDTRFDRVLQIARQWQPPARPGLIEAFLQGRKAIVVGSSWPEDEALWLDYARQKPVEDPLMLVPHEVHENRIAQLLKAWPGKAIRFSALEAAPEQVLEGYSLLIVDRVGLLSRLYAYGGMAYVGGGFGAGIHNVLEAAVYGIPVIFGPHYQHFREACDLVSLGVAFPVNDSMSLDRVLQNLKEAKLDEMGRLARNYVEAHAGATGRIMRYLVENRFLTVSKNA